METTLKTKRFIAGFIDLLVACVIQAILMLDLVIKTQQGQPVIIEHLILLMVFLSFISLSYLIFRDVLGSRSLGKRIMHLRVVDDTSGEAATSKARLLRNVLWVLGPVEVLVFLLKGNRMGDTLAGTTVEWEG